MHRDRTMPVSLKDKVLAEARAACFDAARVTTPAAIGASAGRRLAHFLEQGYHGDMGWMASTAARASKYSSEVPGSGLRLAVFMAGTNAVTEAYLRSLMGTNFRSSGPV